MPIPGLIHNELARNIVAEIMECTESHPIKTAAGFRSAVLEQLFAINPLIDLRDKRKLGDGLSEEGIVTYLIEVVRRTVGEGRMIDFGFIPNEMIKETSLKTRSAFEANEFQHPYETWLGVSRWEGGMCGYLFSVQEEGPDTTRTMAFEIYGIAAPGLPPCVMINDICAIDTIKGETFCQPILMIEESGMNTKVELEKRAANMLDPLVTMMRFLSDASVPVVNVPAPERLNKRRIAKGKKPIPPHALVMTRDYVSAYTSAVSRIRGAGKGGHHASPIAHWRRSHMRHLHDGKVVPVRSSRVNWREAAELHRLFYRAKVTP